MSRMRALRRMRALLVHDRPEWSAISRFLTTALLLTVAIAVIAAPSAQPATRDARNLVATPKVKQALRAAFLAKSGRTRGIKGPLKGTTYYGSYRGREYAFATFSVPRFGTQDQPEVFSRVAGGRWFDRGDTGGEICPGWIPLPLIKVWKLHRSSYSVIRGQKVWCYTP
jgi:hypothetical protein